MNINSSTSIVLINQLTTSATVHDESLMFFLFVEEPCAAYGFERQCLGGIPPISILTFSLLTLLDSNFPGNPLWAWKFHPLKLRLLSSQTL